MANDCIKPRILIYDRLDSTNLEASRISKVSFRAHWILTFEQYQGVGRYGKEWYSCAGNFSGSFLFVFKTLRPSQSQKKIPLIT